jgi:hypothetical protein
VPDQGWGSLPDELAADVRRVTERLAGMSAAQLAGMLPPPEDGMPPYWSRAQAGWAVAQTMADATWAMEHAGSWVECQHALPRLADFAAADQVAVTGHDLLAVMDRVGPDAEVSLDIYDRTAARRAVERAARLLADLRRRL